MVEGLSLVLESKMRKWSFFKRRILFRGLCMVSSLLLPPSIVEELLVSNVDMAMALASALPSAVYSSSSIESESCIGA